MVWLVRRGERAYSAKPVSAATITAIVQLIYFALRAGLLGGSDE